MRISDWSSDVCSSDLVVVEQGIFLEIEAEARRRSGLSEGATLEDVLRDDRANAELHRIGGFTDNESVLVHHGRLRRSLAAQMRMPTSITLPENRSEERRVGKACVSTCRSRLAP